MGEPGLTRFKHGLCVNGQHTKLTMSAYFIKQMALESPCLALNVTWEEGQNIFQVIGDNSIRDSFQRVTEDLC